MFQSSVHIQLSSDDCTVDRLVRSTAASLFLECQGQAASVDFLIHPEKPRHDDYSPELDLHLLYGGNDAERIASTFKFQYFEDSFVQPFCEALLFPADNETRTHLERDCRVLCRLSDVACTERFKGDFPSIPGPIEVEFNHFANDLVELIECLIRNRMLIPTKENFLKELYECFQRVEK
jgi:hypothetical protein